MPGQTDSTPYLAAWSNKLTPDMKGRIVAVSRDLLLKPYNLRNGQVIELKIGGAWKSYTIKDKMGARFTKKFDIWLGGPDTHRAAIQFGHLTNIECRWRE